MFWASKKKLHDDENADSDVAFASVIFNGKFQKFRNVGYKASDHKSKDEMNGNSSGYNGKINSNPGSNKSTKRFQGKSNNCGAKCQKSGFSVKGRECIWASKVTEEAQQHAN